MLSDRKISAFRDVDTPWCPEMVVPPVDDFLMGSPENEERRFSDEGPRHRVTIGYRFAIGRHPITVGEYRRFVEITGHLHARGPWTSDGLSWKEAWKDWRDPGFQQTDRHPVANVSWGDAQAYIGWLEEETGKPYRLPSEAEWEYAARAGATTRYAYGDAITPEDANYGSNVGKTTEVGAYPPNAWDLYDMHGNVREWVEDGWHDNYKGAPNDGSSWTDAEGEYSSLFRVVRGGSWVNNPRNLRSAHRDRHVPDVRGYDLGFRVARTFG